MSKTVIFVGFISPSYLDYFYEVGYNVGFFSEKGFPCNFDKVDKLDFVIPIDMNSQKIIEDQLKDYYFKSDTVLIVTKDRYIFPSSLIAHALKLDQRKNFSIETARKSTNKILQRQAFFENYPEITPNYKKIRTFHGAYLFSRKYNFPLVVKPAGLSQSQLVTISKDLESLIVNVSYTLDHIEEVYKKNHIHRKPQVIIEEFVGGKLYSVDSYVDFNGNVYHTPPCREYTGLELGFDTTDLPYSEYNKELSEKEVEIINDTVSKAIKSLNIIGNATHTEVKIDANGVCKVIEINIRAGGARDTLLRLSYGTEHSDNIIKIICGHKPVINKKLLKYSGYLKLWSQKEGVLKEIRNLEKIEKIPSLIQSHIDVENGEKVGPSKHGFPKVMHFILANENQGQLKADIQNITDTVDFIVEKPTKLEIT